MSRSSIDELNCIFIGGVPHTKDAVVINNKSLGMPQIAAERFQINFLNLLSSVGFESVKFISLPYIGAFPRGTKMLYYSPSVTQQNNTLYGAFSTMPGLYAFSREKSSYILANKLIASREFKSTVIFVYAAHLPFIKTALNIKNKYGSLIKVVLILPDLPQYSSDSKGFSGVFLKSLKSIYFKSFKKYLAKIDGFVFFSDAMAEYFSIKENFFTLYGLPSFNLNNSNFELSNFPVVDKANVALVLFYGGGLSFRYGLKELVDAVLMVNEKGLEVKLWVCGDGDAVNYINNMSNKCSSIQFFGVIPHDQVLALQRDADVLINPRPSKDNFVKYSFPSKMLEYCMHEKPIIGYALSSYPQSLIDSMIIPEEESTEGLAKCIVSTSQLPKYQLDLLGRKAKCFLDEHTSKEHFVTSIKNLLHKIL